MLVKFKSLFVFSEKNKKCFYTDFSDGINIIKGKNTSGKSTLIQSIIYCFGINDSNDKLQEILDEDLVFRLDLEKKNDNAVSDITLIRDGQSYFILEPGKSTFRFDGIGSDNSNEHIKLKEKLSSIFGFKLALESKEDLKPAPLEVMLLPYYVSQSVGWVYLRESFSGLNYYKNFKFDYLDYYLGITSDIDRIELHKLLRTKSELVREIEFLEKMKNNDEKLQLSQLLDEEFRGEASKYLSEYSQLRESLVKEETHHVHLCNKKSLATNRKVVLNRVRRNILHQRPEIDSCPVCSQLLPNSLEDVYVHQQDINDTESEIVSVKAEIVDLQSKINSVNNKIDKISDILEDKYSVVMNYQSSSSNVSFDTWLDHKSNVKLIGNINNSLSDKAVELKEIIREIEGFGVDKDIDSVRSAKEQLFWSYFKDCLSDLNLANFEESRYKQLYKINSFPRQGVELHKTVIAYHFALNKLISKTQGIHRFPFILDAVMKEDIEEENRKTIFLFLNDHAPSDTQMIFSVSESLSHSKGDDKTTNNIELVNEIYFSGKGKIIQIGDGDSERSFLNECGEDHEQLIQSTLDMINIA
ncbi:hypothetical protein CLH62_17015 [Marinobacter guineae]|uniref:Rad50/SbcC-type AAA domain-containing protein n=1 Tax=Marinobacter guineae TaxID=432303 RepID=A0A2G1VD46_9GAMM|nr:ATP-binding protein [Marinobacter guineae]PHQ24590.1 hypothetical protein CLH62_17015 [Marinobacter guineae]